MKGWRITAQVRKDKKTKFCLSFLIRDVIQVKQNAMHAVKNDTYVYYYMFKANMWGPPLRGLFHCIFFY